MRVFVFVLFWTAWTAKGTAEEGRRQRLLFCFGSREGTAERRQDTRRRQRFLVCLFFKFACVFVLFCLEQMGAEKGQQKERR